MSNQPFMQLYVGDYLADTTDLTCEEHGAYLLLLMTMWRHGAKLPNDHKKLARIARLSPRKWKSVWGEIERFFEVDGSHIRNKRLTKEHQKATEKSELRAQAGSKGGKAKALKNNNTPLANATVLPKQGQKSEPDIDDDDSAGARGLTEREQLLLAMGHDQSGVTANGRIVGNRSDMAEAGRWSDDLGLTHSEQIEVIKDVCARKRDGPPNSFTYFTEAMRRAAGEKSRARLTPSEPKYSNVIPASIPRVRAQLPE